MTRRFRLVLFLISCAVFAALYARGLDRLHPFGAGRGTVADAYSQTVDALTVPARHITDAVTAVNFDFRGFDTLGEEYIMFASIVGVALLLRQRRRQRNPEPKDKASDREIPASSDAVRLLTVALAGPTVVFGLYIVTHGQITPGGGFQGGVILASAPLLIYLAGEFQSLRRLAPRWLAEISEALGAGGYILIGAAAMFGRSTFLTNVLPLGKAGDVFSGGTVALIDLAVGLEVAGGFLLLLLVFLEEVLVRKDPL
jgi:multicomponent Na+:H+ antiporter subunit B